MTDDVGEAHDQDRASQWLEKLNNVRSAVTDTDETCVFILDDLLSGIFEEMQVRTENKTIFAGTARQVCVQIFESVGMSTLKPSDSLNELPGGSRARQQMHLVQSEDFIGKLSLRDSESVADSHQKKQGRKVWSQTESQPRAVEIDRQVPGQIGKKATSSASQRDIMQKVLLQMARPLRQESRWKTVQHKVGADVDFKSAQSHATRRSTRTFSRDVSAAKPDAAALSSTVSLSTPRQLPIYELDRRQDLLAQVEWAIACRTIANKIALMNVNGPPLYDVEPHGSSSQVDRHFFQAHVAANSTVSTGAGSVSPTRPPHSQKRTVNPRSRFELERKPLPFVISDDVREKHDHVGAAVCSPIQRLRPLALPESPRPEPPLSMLPSLDSSCLAMGVKAVISGVEIQGPRRSPSRNSRLRLHNYQTAENALDHRADTSDQLPFSPVQTKVVRDEDSRWPILPVVSPIKALSHRKHVLQEGNTANESRIAISPKLHVRQRPVGKVKQQVWETSNRFPPRVRNYHVASGKPFRKFYYLHDKDEDTIKVSDTSTIFQPLAAPRRNVLPTAVDWFNPE